MKSIYDEPFVEPLENRLNAALSNGHKRKRKSFEPVLDPKQKSILSGIKDPVDKLQYIRTREVSS